MDKTALMGLRLTLLAVALGSSPAGAQVAAPATEPAPSAFEEAMEAPLELSITPYLWATSLHGNAGVGRTDADVDVSFSDIFKNLNGALMLDLELRKGRFGLMSDTVYANLGDNAESAHGRLKIDANVNQLVQGVAATYRVGNWQLADLPEGGSLRVALDPYAGIRYTYLDTELKGKLDLPDLGVNKRRTAEGSEHWVDPIIGLRTIGTLGDHLSLTLAGDIGGTSQSSDYSAQAIAFVGYRFQLIGKSTVKLIAGYRVLHQKYEDGDGRSKFEWDVTMRGPVLGAVFQW